MTLSPIQVFIPDHPQTFRTLRQKLEEAKQRHINDLMGSQDWDDYNQRVGHIRGIMTALRICDEIEKDMKN